MATLVFDIETVGEDFDAIDATTQEMLTRWIKRESGDDAEVYRAKLTDLKEGLGFSPLTGEIVAIGVWDLERARGVVYYQDPTGKEVEEEADGVKLKPMSEAAMLKAFWDGATQYDTFVSFNGRAFDVPFLMTRSAINGVRPTKDLMSNRYLGSQRAGAKHVDLFDQLTYYGAVSRSKGGLHLWCRAFGIESPKAGGVAGDDVAGLFREGKGKDIARYNVGDIVATAALYEKWHALLAPDERSRPVSW